MKQVKPCPFECNANDCKDCGAYTYSHHTLKNEEWFCSLSTEEKAEKLTDFSFWLVPNLPKEDKREQVRKWIENWLKEKHDAR